MSEPDYVRTVGSGAELTDDPLTLHPEVARDLDAQMRAMEQARDAAAVSGRDYLIAATPQGAAETGSGDG